ncbi:MAG: ribonuclease PH [Rickettsiales bacterium]
MRHANRSNNALRNISIETNVNKHAEGSCLIKFGDTHVLCTASIEESLPPFLRGKNQGGWVTAEYSLLPRSTETRIRREVSQGKPSGRTHEIQRLISRSLRSVVNLKALGDRQVLIDCDVLQADGGTRTAAITGGYVALHLALETLVAKKIYHRVPLTSQVAAISCGIIGKEILLDIDYKEDSNADVDANFVLNSEGKLIEIQGTAEKNPFTEEQFIGMLKLSQEAAKQLFEIQLKALGK